MLLSPKFFRERETWILQMLPWGLLIPPQAPVERRGEEKKGERDREKK